MKTRHISNELEFQGNVLTWINIELKSRPALGLEIATQEASKIDSKRNDLVVWHNRASNHAFLTIELKTPTTPITDNVLILDACKKAQKWESPFFVIWNMQIAEIYLTPEENKSATPADRIQQFPPNKNVTSVDDWIDESIREELQTQTVKIIDFVWHEALKKGISLPIDATVFVERIVHRIEVLREEIYPELIQKIKRNKALRNKILHIATSQGYSGLVDDISKALVGQFCYRLVGQILFYFALKRHQPSLKELKLDNNKSFMEAIRPYWDEIRRFDYEAIYKANELDEIVPVTKNAETILKVLINEFNKYDWNTLRDDILGSIFEQLIPEREQTLLGQFFTSSLVADFLIVLALDGENPKLLDPGCGSGTFLLRSYQYLHDTQRMDHPDLLESLWGFDISPFAAQLAVINLFRQNLSEFENFPRVLNTDFFEVSVGDLVEFPPSREGIQGKIEINIPIFDAIVANPPYIRSQQQDDLDPKYKDRLFSVFADEQGLESPSKTDLFAFFVYHSYQYLRDGGRIGFVTSSSWLTADYGYYFQRFLIEKFNLIAVISSEVESFFTQVDQNTVLFVAEKRPINENPSEAEVIRFVTLKQKLNNIISEGNDHWLLIQKFANEIESANSDFENENLRIRCISTYDELERMKERNELRNWSINLRAPRIYFSILDNSTLPFIPLTELAHCHLGYKALQNKFYYLSKEIIKTYKIEKEFLIPIYMMRDLQSDKIIQTIEPETFLFYCNSPENDIRGTGALNYIRDMEDRPAKKKKQSDKSSSISEVLEKQGGKHWYYPKAIPHKSNIWIRKAFDGVYAPFIFTQPQVVDQRCN
ncbi:MAG: N-6 DNA methylase [Candidatus Electryonea clarkiae]|nr:N-6 DNA methylase [Candidatus Electryonea clarkiae]MDP8285937.1 N-6 DNA methylase [Candidatus Electryonea clarkiae]